MMFESILLIRNILIWIDNAKDELCKEKELDHFTFLLYEYA